MRRDFEKVSAGGAPGARFDGIGPYYLPAGGGGQSRLWSFFELFQIRIPPRNRRDLYAEIRRGAKATLAN
jgi:hypothetical protein